VQRVSRSQLKQKDPNDVRGVKINCPMFEKCPLCYGCRAFNPAYEECRTCEVDNKKKNVCNTDKHRSDLLARMITREVVVVKGAR
jgi:hypothetical protein